MIVTTPGKVSDRITLLGREESCVYLVDGGSEYAILGGGMPYIIPDVLDQLEQFQIDESKISRLVIHHAHFDHVGAMPFFKKRWPRAKITASKRAQQNLARPAVMETILALNKGLLSSRGLEDKWEEFGLDIDIIVVDEALEDGNVIKLGDLDINFLETPGHSSCSMAAYISSEKALSASDAGGIPYGDQVFAAANSNFDKYQQSLEKMAALDIEIHMAEHYGARTGEDARNYMKKSIESAAATRKLMEEAYARNLDEAKTVEEVSELLAGPSSGYFLPKEVMAMVLGQMVKYIARMHQQKQAGS